jgi:hypothetical protein
MHRLILICAGIQLLMISKLPGQSMYSTQGGELILSFADITLQGHNINDRPRFSFFLHLGKHWHQDITSHLGFFSGANIRNIGFIEDHGTHVIKRRAYSLGVPLAVKLGNLNEHFYLYGGGEYEFFFHYKQKRLEGKEKIKFSGWFNERTSRFVPSVYAGLQFPRGINLKFRYYLENFMNTSFRGVDFGHEVDYADFNARVYNLSLTFTINPKKIKKIIPGKEAEHFALF